VSTPRLQVDVPLRDYTTFGIGGPARLFLDVRSSEQLREAALWARRDGRPCAILGCGSNVLAADEGYPGLLIRNCRSERVELLSRNRVRADSGVTIARLIALAQDHGLGGLEHFAGIPSTLGGALWQNLHFLAPDRRRLVFLGELVEEATVLVGDRLERVDRDWFSFGYDASRLRKTSAIVLDATLRLVPSSPERLRATSRANLAWRARRHPPDAVRRSAGCVFRNPDGESAARVIDAAGLKGARVGGASVSRQHANFILNDGGATAADVRALIRLVRERVYATTGIRLEPEIAFCPAQGPGDWFGNARTGAAAGGRLRVEVV
jgi:UDP-N-acetylmuramate dehydrogenase